ncbi:nicotinate-nucleotide adenylyltransferase [Robertmurraya yapensis]|uniref:Nicotinate-nucleotide adenylyltransferase n=2 Tax=Bacillaceae TaxID=186817 RepID=A0ACC6S8C6_9BACI|nr:nicotinate-nucleotide adenylyltransferase [Bacillus yapensis]RTR35350.1 nicotinate-nucleotide adenylyltransferase [Bacillus yapensis]TKS97859.1 nicotinate-nucleotide adenylyltransferase [Bacillus yapensis]
MRKIGILGGTFDPPHHGHLLIANEALHGLSLDEIWFLPNQEPPHKKKSGLMTNEDRLNMLELVTKDVPYFRVETIELERSGPSYTYDTIKQLKEMHADVQFYFIIGADMIEYLPKWYKIDELMDMISFIGVNRPTFEEKTSYPIIHLDIPEFSVSSSLIRQRMLEGKTIRYLLPDSIIEYLKEKNLYGA